MKFILIQSLLLIPLLARGQSGVIKGTVSDPEGPVEFASVRLEGTQKGTVSDRNGSFVLTDVSEGENTVVLTHLGYAEERLRVQVLPGKISEISVLLLPEFEYLNEMVITGSRTEKEKSLSAVTVSVLDQQTLESTQSITLADGLNFQPGLRVEVNCQTCNYTQLRINGLSGSYSQMLINNRPVFSSLMGLYGLEQFPASLVEKIEVIKGGGSALYGSSAIGGTVNIITKDPEEDEFSFVTQGSLIGGESPDLNFNGRFSKVFENSGISLFASGRARDAYDHNEDDFTEIPETRNLNVGLQGYHKFNPYARLNVDFYRIQEYRRGGNKLEEAPHLSDQAEERDQETHVGGIEFNQAFTSLNSNLDVYLAGQHTGRSHYTGVDGVDGYGTTVNYSLNSGFQWNLYLKNNTISAGIDYQHEYVDDRIPYYNYLINQSSHLTGFFAQTDWNITPKFTMLGGFRFDLHNFLDDPVVSPRINLLYKPNPFLGIRGGYSTGFRAPQAFDADLHIAFSGGGISYVRLADDLDKERSQSFTASVSFDKPHEDYIYGFTVDGFYTMIHNSFVLEDAGTDDMGNLILEKRNGSNSKVFGFTVEGRLNYRYLIETSLGFTLQQSEYEEPVVWSEEVKGSGNTCVRRMPMDFSHFCTIPSEPFTSAFPGLLPDP